VSTRDACGQLRLKTERKAFERFPGEFETLWPRTLAIYKK
jgi:hypothetical protein